MPKDEKKITPTSVTVLSAKRGIKECPNCKGSVFQGPFTRGEIVDDVFHVRETLYQCVTCHAVKPMEELRDR